MAILYSSSERVFHLKTAHTSYIFCVNGANRLHQLYYGERLDDTTGVLQSYAIKEAAFQAYQPGDTLLEPPGTLPSEFSGSNTGDYRMTALGVTSDQGVYWADPRYASHTISNEKRPLHGLPQSFAGKTPDAMQQLAVTLEDPHTGLEVTLLYAVFEDCDVIARSTIIQNTSNGALTLQRAMSLQFDLVNAANMETITFIGHWANERAPERRPLHQGLQINGSIRGTSGHENTPGMILCEPTTTETTGLAYGFILAYSGNHCESAELEQNGSVRILAGIHPEHFAWRLEAGESFETPEAFMTFSPSGFEHISRHFHDFIRGHLIRSSWNGKKRPILVNNWEATYFDFNTEKIVAIAKEAAALGIEMMVLDDGWFGHRNDDKSSLGDWFEFSEKIGDMADLSREIHALGLKFGLWFEPEMISEDSELYKKHPDWAICVPNRPRSLSRTQLILDFSRREIVDCLFDMMSSLIRRANIDYIKWDMNRNMTDVYSIALPPERQGEVCHRYVLGVYDLHERLLREFPNLLIEGCSGGGGRFDAGMLYYVPQIWCSDNANAINRIQIQAGTSMLYPVAAMGAHVNQHHEPWGLIPFMTRGNVAMTGTFGFELDLTQLTDDERQDAKTLIARYHDYHDVFSEGNYYRLTNAFQRNDFEAWSAVSKDQSRCVVTAVNRNIIICHFRPYRMKLRGLDPAAHYRLTVNGEKTDVVYSGALLMNSGFWTRDIGWYPAASAVYLFDRI